MEQTITRDTLQYGFPNTTTKEQWFDGEMWYQAGNVFKSVWERSWPNWLQARLPCQELGIKPGSIIADSAGFFASAGILYACRKLEFYQMMSFS